ncbi:unnamed protein product [Polarella glacialis]|nr:unnamed protein product [Polarella glacialis]
MRAGSVLCLSNNNSNKASRRRLGVSCFGLAAAACCAQVFGVRPALSSGQALVPEVVLGTASQSWSSGMRRPGRSCRGLRRAKRKKDDNRQEPWFVSECLEDVRKDKGIKKTQDGENLLGVAGFYTATTWHNPWQDKLEGALSRALSDWDERGFFLKSDWDAEEGHPLGRVLDLACGSGEASMALMRWAELWPGAVATLEASDPFNFDSYESRTGRKAHKWSFGDVAGGALDGQGTYDLVLCTFAMHLVEGPELLDTLKALSTGSRLLVIGSSRKEPHVTKKSGWELLDYKPFSFGGGIRLALYRSQHFGGGW